MSEPRTLSKPKGLEGKQKTLEDLAAEALRHPQKNEGDVCIGTLPTRGGQIVVWSADESKEFCKIAGQSVRRLGYLPWASVEGFLRDRMQPSQTKPSNQEFASALQTGTGAAALTEEQNSASRVENRGNVVELREVRPPTFFWETLREVLPPGGLKFSRR